MERRGQINEYCCDACGSIIHTINLSNGTTPFCLGCDCKPGAFKHSQFYRLSSKPLVTEAFYRPAALSDQRVSDYVMGGALLHAPLAKACVEMMQDDPTEVAMTADQWRDAIATKWGVSADRVQEAIDPFGQQISRAKEDGDG